MYAIQNKRTKKFVYGTDYRMTPHRQKTSKDQMLTYQWLDDCESEFEHRQCGKDYKIVEVEIIVKDKIEKRETLWNYKEPYVSQYE